MQAPTEKNLSQLRNMLGRAEAVQTYAGRQIWGHPVRTIHSTDVLVVEDALRCVTSPHVAPYWAYQTAKEYAECYNSRYGTGLIPESLPMLENIMGFWIDRDQ